MSILHSITSMSLLVDPPGRTSTAPPLASLAVCGRGRRGPSSPYSNKMSSKGPNLKGYLEKQVCLHLNKGRKVTGTMRGYDNFMNVVLEDATDDSNESSEPIGTISVRGNSILQFELVGVGR
jgi:small nuclear ribonucleoprotein G